MEKIMFRLFEYDVSGYVLFESGAVLITFLCVLAAVRQKIITFPLGMAGTGMYFAIFYMQRVYSSMILQVVFFSFNVYGFYKWTHPDPDKADSNNRLSVTILTIGQRATVLFIVILLTCVSGYASSNYHIWFPEFFPEPAKYVFIDAFILSASLVAQYLMAIKKLENWVIWLIIDLIAAPFYFLTVGAGTGLLYTVFIVTAVAGLTGWYKSYKKPDTSI